IGLHVVLGNTKSLRKKEAVLVLRAQVSSFSCLAVPHRGLLVVLGDAVATSVSLTKIELGLNVSSLRGSHAVGHCLGRISLDAIAYRVHECQVGLRGPEAGVGRFGEQSNGSLYILGNAVPLIVQTRQQMLSRRVATLRCLLEVLKSGCVVAFVVGSNAFIDTCVSGK